MTDVATVASNIEAGKYGGSSLVKGTMYHNLPFPGMAQINSHRGNTAERIEQLKQNFELDGKKILDIGCNVGGLSIGCGLEGADVYGVDYDEGSIETAKSAADHLNLKNVQFETVTVDENWTENMAEYDIVIWMSNWMWIVKQYGLETAKRMLFNVSSKCKEMFFESSANDGMAAIPNSTQQDIYNWLDESTGFETIKVMPPLEGWMKRNVHLCKDNKNEWRATSSMCTRIDKDTVLKKYEQEHMWMKDREIEFLKQLEKYNIVPKILEVGEDFIKMSYCGKRLSNYSDRVEHFKPFANELYEIVDALSKERITHRDIHVHNLLKLGDKVRLIDFGWALFEGEEDTPKPIPEGGASFGIWEKCGKSDRKVVETILDGVTRGEEYVAKYGEQI